MTSLPVLGRPYRSVQITFQMVFYLHAKFRGDWTNGLGAKASLPVFIGHFLSHEVTY